MLSLDVWDPHRNVSSKEVFGNAIVLPRDSCLTGNGWEITSFTLEHVGFLSEVSNYSSNVLQDREKNPSFAFFAGPPQKRHKLQLGENYAKRWWMQANAAKKRTQRGLAFAWVCFSRQQIRMGNCTNASIVFGKEIDTARSVFNCSCINFVSRNEVLTMFEKYPRAALIKCKSIA